MGEYLNPSNQLFRRALQSEIYVDKSLLITQTNRRLDTNDQFFCVSRPRRFGKSMTLDMLCAYYSLGCDSRELFSQLKISSSPDFEEHLNQYNVIQICATDFIKSDRSVADSLSILQKYLVRELKREFSEADVLDWNELPLALDDIYVYTNIPFVFLIDEWDSVFREHAGDSKGKETYLHFLRDLLKDKKYVALAYMTGIFPVKQYGDQSALNMFSEYSMTDQSTLAEFTGFTEQEVADLCRQYDMDMDQMKFWYNGYDVNGIATYNPQSVTEAIRSRNYRSYWTKTSTYKSLKGYIEMNFDGLKDKVARLISGESIYVNTDKFQNDAYSMGSADDVLTLLIHIGYLTYHIKDKTVSIPNSEVQQEFYNAIEDGGWEPLVRSIQESSELLSATIDGEEKRVAEIIDKIHTEYTSLIKYNDENSLSCVLTIAYYAAKMKYTITREVPAGKGYADLIFVPLKTTGDPAMVVELKWNKDTNTALQQIKEKQYTDVLQDYHGNVLLVGINYDKETKKHTCRIEKI